MTEPIDDVLDATTKALLKTTVSSTVQAWLAELTTAGASPNSDDVWNCLLVGSVVQGTEDAYSNYDVIVLLAQWPFVNEQDVSRDDQRRAFRHHSFMCWKASAMTEVMTASIRTVDMLAEPDEGEILGYSLVTGDLYADPEDVPQTKVS